MSFWWGIWKPKGWRLGHEAHHFPLAVPDRASFSTVGISFDARNEGFWGSKYRTLGGATGCLGNLDQVYFGLVLYFMQRLEEEEVPYKYSQMMWDFNMAKKGVSKQTDWLGRNFPKSKLEICRDFIKDIPWKLRCQSTPGNSGTLCPFWDGEHVRSGDQVWSQLESPGTFQFLIS